MERLAGVVVALRVGIDRRARIALQDAGAEPRLQRHVRAFIRFIRPNRLVLASELTRYPAFNSALLRSIRSRLLGKLLERVRIDLWDQVDGHSAETAGWLALASLYRDGWGAPVDVQATAAAAVASA